MTPEDSQALLNQALRSLGAIPLPAAEGCCASTRLHGLEVDFRWRPRSGEEPADDLHAMVYLRDDPLDMDPDDLQRLLVANGDIGAQSPFFFCLEPQSLRPALTCCLGRLSEHDQPNLARALDATIQAVRRWHEPTH